MVKFSYTALNKEKKTVNGTIEASDRNSAISTLRKQSLRPVGLRVSTEGKKRFNIDFFGSKVKSKDLVVFTRQLSTMINAGVPLLRALNILQGQTESKKLASTLESVVKDLQGGMSLADALARHPKVFNDVYSNMIRAGESAGILDEILKRLALQQEKNDSMKKKIRGAMTYPAVLLFMTFGAFFGLMLFIVPQISEIITELSGPDTELPILTQIMLGISGFVQNYWYIVFASIGLLIFAFNRYVSSPKGKANFHEIILKIPIVGKLIKKVAVARFSRTFASLMGAGVSVLEALKVTGRAVGNESYKRELDNASEQVKNGKQLSEALTGNPYFPVIVPQMLSVGEETGETDEVLIKVADFYEEEVDVMIDSLNSIIEPIMIAILGAMVGLIAASVIGPISELSKNIE